MATKKPLYLALASEDLGMLEMSVRNAINDGYVPAGGLALRSSVAGDFGYYQAMWLAPPPLVRIVERNEYGNEPMQPGPQR